MDKIPPTDIQAAWAEIREALAPIDVSGITPAEFFVLVRYLCGASSAAEVGQQLYKEPSSIHSQISDAKTRSDAPTTITLLAALLLVLRDINEAAQTEQTAEQ